MNRDWLDVEVLEDYLDGKLDTKTMNRIEREALEDPFVAEALAGLSESPKRAMHSISLLQKQLHERVAQHQNIKKTSVVTWQRLSIAATAAVLFIAVSIIFWMKENNHQKQLAGQPKKVDVTIAPKTPDISPVQPVPALAAGSNNRAKSGNKKVQTEIDKAMKEAEINAYAARIKPKAAPDDIKPPSDVNKSLNEVMVVGYGKAKKNALSADSGKLSEALAGKVAGISRPVVISNPVDGWDKLFEYINTNNRFSKDVKTGQTVEISFRIDKNGNATAIKIIQSAEEKYNKEARRLILNGPKWEQPKQARSRMNLKIDF